MRKKHLVTAALPYANGPLHIGHIAGCYLPADIYVRFLKRKGEDVKFICGSDEHGVAITMRARKEGVQPQNIVDRYHEMMKKAFQEFGIQFDIYSRTSNPIHHQTAQDFFSTLHNKGVFEDRVSAQYFDTEAQQFLADRYIMGTCPTCSNPDAYGDQCEKCGRTLSPSELLNPRSTLSGSKPILKDTRNWFLPLDKMADDIRAFLNTRQNWKPNVLGQCKSWLDSGDGLQPRSMTRDMDWGLKYLLIKRQVRYCMFGLMPQLATFLPPKNFFPIHGKSIGKALPAVWCILLAKTILCFIASFFRLCLWLMAVTNSQRPYPLMNS